MIAGIDLQALGMAIGLGILIVAPAFCIFLLAFDPFDDEDSE